MAPESWLGDLKSNWYKLLSPICGSSNRRIYGLRYMEIQCMEGLFVILSDWLHKDEHWARSLFCKSIARPTLTTDYFILLGWIEQFNDGDSVHRNSRIIRDSRHTGSDTRMSRRAIYSKGRSILRLPCLPTGAHCQLMFGARSEYQDSANVLFGFAWCVNCLSFFTKVCSKSQFSILRKTNL